jgi:hypothetical protein
LNLRKRLRRVNGHHVLAAYLVAEPPQKPSKPKPQYLLPKENQPALLPKKNSRKAKRKKNEASLGVAWWVAKLKRIKKAKRLKVAGNLRKLPHQNNKQVVAVLGYLVGDKQPQKLHPPRLKPKGKWSKHPPRLKVWKAKNLKRLNQPAALVSLDAANLPKVKLRKVRQPLTPAKLLNGVVY